jgi:hypothetical protein
MKYKLILLFFLTSCTSYSSSVNSKSGYFGSGFAIIEKNIVSNNSIDDFFVAHNTLRVGTKIRIINPNNNKSLETVVKKKIDYDNFYKALVSSSVADKLNLSFEFPLIEINVIKSNKSFIAKKAITDVTEKKIANNAPIDQISINNISKKKKLYKKKTESYSILVADFYSLSSAEFLKNKLSSILKDSNYQLIYIDKISEKKYELLLGPYNTINKLKNDYIILTDSNFEDLDIKIND